VPQGPSGRWINRNITSHLACVRHVRALRVGRRAASRGVTIGLMPNFTSYDGTELAYRQLGAGAPPLVCVPGGPGRDAAYLENLAGLDASRTLLVLDNRGTGASAVARDPASYAFPRLAEDIEAFRGHLHLDRFALLAHSAAATTALAYAARHGERLTHLVLVCPGTRILGERTTDVREIFRSRSGDPWFDDAREAMEEMETATDLLRVKELLPRVAPLLYGRWEKRQLSHAVSEPGQLHPVPRAGFWQGVDEGTRLAILHALPRVGCPVLVVTGALDAATGVEAGALVAGLFPRARHTTLPGAGHFPWVDVPRLFRSAVDSFLAGSSPSTT
jgi:proline iminopeptidase